LNLQKRTVSENAPSPAAGAGESKSSPFGAARPIDTAAREREVAEKRERARKEAEDKAKAEKTEKAEKQRQAKEQAKAEKGASGDANGAKEGDSEAPRGKTFEVLRRTAEDENDMTARDEVDEPTEESTPAKEVSSDEPVSKTNGNWRSSATPATANEAADEEGWSTVSTTKRNNRRGQGRGI
jgi:translation initiation factor 4B